MGRRVRLAHLETGLRGYQREHLGKDQMVCLVRPEKDRKACQREYPEKDRKACQREHPEKGLMVCLVLLETDLRVHLGYPERDLDRRCE